MRRSAASGPRRGTEPRARVRLGTERREMANGNSVTLVGNITRDPELRFTASGQATASFGLAVNRRWQNRQTNDWQAATSSFNVVCWREMVAHPCASLQTASRVIAAGGLEQRSSERQAG